MKKGLLLVNLGTPKSPHHKDVKTYLAEFLMDPYVIDLPYPFRLLLVKGIILNTRPKKSALNYQKVWTERGSPLLSNSVDLKEKVQRQLPHVHVELAMRYQEPGLEGALESLKNAGVEDLTILPLYPHYAHASTKSTEVKVNDLLRKITFKKKQFIPYFYDRKDYIQLWANKIRNLLKNHRYDKILFSYHGLPIRQVQKASQFADCYKSPHCCDQITEANKFCYRAQSFENTRLVVKELGSALDPHTKIETSFQSRLTSKWIEPFTDKILERWQAEKVKSVLVVSPSFVADCLETLEEIQIGLRDKFLASGGTKFDLVPSLNSDDEWAVFVSSLV